MYYDAKKEIIKSAIFITLTLLLAIILTYFIYNKFQVKRNIDFNSDSLDVTYHESTGDKITINKITPVTDSVGLSSKSYNITLKNNLTEIVNYKIKILDDLKTISTDECHEKLIPKEDIRISIKEGNKENKIYNLNDLENNTISISKIEALNTKEISIRLWINHNSILPLGSNLHYHGLMQVIEDDKSIAINK